MNKTKKRTYIFLAIISLLLLVLVYHLYQNMQYKKLHSQNTAQIMHLNEQISSIAHRVDQQNQGFVDTAPSQENSLNENNNNSDNLLQGNETVNSNTTMTILVPHYNAEIGTTFSQYQVPKSPAVLKAVYTQLFKNAGNQNAVWNGYSFNSVSIHDKTATVNLNGSWYPAGDMSSYSFREMIKAAAFQYPTVDTLVVKENGSIIDWCMDDMSNGEGGCPAQPQHWIEAK